MNIDDLIALKNELVSDPAYAERNYQYRNNWLAYRGRYDEIVGSIGGSSVPKGTDVHQRRDYSMQVWNLQKPIVDSTVMFLARLPQIVVPPPTLGVPDAGAKADRIEKILYALWDKNNMVSKHGYMAFLLACFGTSVEFVKPDEVAGIPVIMVRHPGTCYPMPKGEGVREFDFVLFTWQEKISTARRRFPHDKPIPDLKTIPGSSSIVDVIEYIDDKEYILCVGEQLARYKLHSLGYVPVRITPSMETGQLFGPCEIDQLIATNIYLNMLMTKLADALEENLYPTTFFIGNDPVPINTGPGAYTWLPEGTQAQRLDPVRIPPELWHQVSMVEDFVRTHAHWPRVMSGEVQGGYATGRAIQRMQAPSMGLAAIRQMNMGYDLSVCNEYMLRMLEDIWPKKEFTLNSVLPTSTGSPPGRSPHISVSFVPERDIQGYYLNQVRYSIWGMDFNASVAAALPLHKAGIFSKLTILNNLPGTDDASGELAQVRQEKRDEMELEIELRRRLLEAETQAVIAQQQAAAGQADANQAAANQAAAQSNEQAGAAAPPIATEVMPNNMPGGPIAMQTSSPVVMGIGEPLVGKESFPLPWQSVQPFGQSLAAMGATSGGKGQPIERMPEPDMITAEEVIEALRKVQKLRGAVYLLGRIAQYGETPGAIELGVTNPYDKATIINAPSMKPYYGKLDITILRGKIPEEAVPVIGGENVE